jgi:hypothetical protein
MASWSIGTSRADEAAVNVARARALLRGVWDFVVGDDWRTAVGVVAALALTALIADAGVSAWWLMPLAVLALLGWSVRRAARDATRRPDAS